MELLALWPPNFDFKSAACGKDLGKRGAFDSTFVSSTISLRSIASEAPELLARSELYRVAAGCGWASSGDAVGD
jgi:hypothetical protein